MGGVNDVMRFAKIRLGKENRKERTCSFSILAPRV